MKPNQKYVGGFFDERAIFSDLGIKECESVGEWGLR